MEAYGILSVKESRVNYDLSMKRNPDQYKEMSQSEFDKNYNVDLRDGAGNTPVDAPRAGSYAE